MDSTNIVINGVKLTEGQTMTIHVALQNFAMDLKSKDGNIGEPLNSSYLRNIREINNISVKKIINHQGERKSERIIENDEVNDCIEPLPKKIKDDCKMCLYWNKKSGNGYYKCLGTTNCPVGKISYKPKI